MKLKKLLALVFTAIMVLGCMTITALADGTEYSLTIEQASITLPVGSTKVLTAKAIATEGGQDITSEVSIEWESLDKTIVTIKDGTITAVKEGTTTVTAKTSTQTATCEVVVISGSETLNLETGDDYSEKKEIEQKYTFKYSEEEYTDVTKVKLEWTINDVVATYTSHKTWDPNDLKWVEEKEGINANTDGAEFDFTNYSSKIVVANVSFAVGESLKNTYDADSSTFENNDCKVLTPVTKENDSYKDSDFTAKKETIKVTLALKSNEFVSLFSQNTATKYGTYTVTISEANPNYLKFTANTVGSTITPKFQSGSYQYSVDNGKTWEEGTIDGTTTITLESVGDNVMLKGDNCTTFTNKIVDYSVKCPNFEMTGSIAASGSVTSLTDGVGNNPNVTLTNNCYQGMFINCTSLTTAPELPATNLASYCYTQMFKGCTSLTSAPELPATRLSTSCYQEMFCGCTSLKTAPALLATELMVSCYSGMFINCTKLTTLQIAKGQSSVLPATTLEINCYNQMFVGCASLKITTDSSVSGAKKVFTCPSTIPMQGIPATYLMFKTTDEVASNISTPTASGTVYYFY